MRRRLIATAFAGAALWATVAAAPAGAVSHPTEVTVDFAGIGTEVFVEGRVLSSKQACQARRKVRIIAIAPDGNEVVDRDRTSDNGFYGGGGTAEGRDRPTGVKVKAPRTTFKRHGRHHVCRGDVNAVHIPPG
jgi:hypothetical protein